MTSASGKPRLLIVTSTFPRWPDDHEPPFVYELARRLTTSFDVSVIAPHAPGAKLRDVMDGVTVHRFRYAPDRFERLAYDGGIPTRLRRQPWLALLLPSFVLAQLFAALRLTIALRPTAVHAHWLLPGGLVGAIAKELVPGRRRLVITAHGADVQLTNRLPVGFLKRQAIDSADLITVVSQALARQIEPAVAASSGVAVAPMGVDLIDRFIPGDNPPEPATIVFAGRLVEKKGVADLLEALVTVREHCPAIRLLIVGHGPLEGELRALVARLDLDASVEFVGSVPNAHLPAIWHRARLGVLPFRTADDGDVEGLGLAAVEAMGCQVPVIVGDVPAIHDVVRHADTGWIVPSNAPAQLAAAIVQLLEDTALSARLAANGRRFVVDHFDWSNVAAHYASLLEPVSD